MNVWTLRRTAASLGPLATHPDSPIICLKKSARAISKWSCKSAREKASPELSFPRGEKASVLENYYNISYKTIIIYNNNRTYACGGVDGHEPTWKGILIKFYQIIYKILRYLSPRRKAGEEGGVVGVEDGIFFFEQDRGVYIGEEEIGEIHRP